MNVKEYNGWTNYETWLTKLWIDNDQGLQELVLEEAGRSTYSDYRRWLKDYIEQIVQEAGPETGLAADLLNAALMEVNFDEIAKSYQEDAQQYAEELAEHRKGF